MKKQRQVKHFWNLPKSLLKTAKELLCVGQGESIGNIDWFTESMNKSYKFFRFLRWVIIKNNVNISLSAKVSGNNYWIGFR